MAHLRRACRVAQIGWSRQFSGSRWSSRSSTVTAPSRRPSSSTTGRSDQVVGGEVGRDLVDRGLGAQGVHGVVEGGRDQGRRRLAQQPLDVRDPEQPAGRGLQRRPADVDHARPGTGVQLGVADVGQGVGDGRVGPAGSPARASSCRRRSPRRRTSAGGRPRPRRGSIRLEQRGRGLGRQVGDQVGGVVGRHLLEHVGGALAVEVPRISTWSSSGSSSRTSARRSSSRAATTAVRRSGGRSWITLAASAGRISLRAAIRWVAPCVGLAVRRGRLDVAPLHDVGLALAPQALAPAPARRPG